MAEKLVYKDLEFPTFVNSNEAIRLTTYDKNGETETIKLPLSDAIKSAVLAGVSILNIGDTRCGKSRVMRDIHRSYFGGNSDTGGNSNWNVARNDFVADRYFMTTDQSKIGEGKGLLIEAYTPVEHRIKSLCNIVDEINLAIPEIQVEFFGIAEGRHKDYELGKEGYHLFMSSCNLNRINGDFTGTSQINRALLNRFGVTFDFDYFQRTDEDEETAMLRAAEGTEIAPIKDISEKIISANKKIRDESAKREPWIDAYLRIFSLGLDYCGNTSMTDHKKKKAWPSLCGNCNFASRDICSLIKQSNTGTIGLIRRFAHGINHLVQLKYGEKNIDPFDLALGAFQFSTYHGNLNGIETISTYGGEDQEQMRDVVFKIKEKIMPIKYHIDRTIQYAVEKGIPETRFIKRTTPNISNPIDEIYSQDDIKKLEEAKIQHKTVNPFRDFETETGLRIDWIDSYLQSIAKHYK